MGYSVCNKIFEIIFSVLYIQALKPVLIYGAETWVLSKVDKLRLGVFERKILRRIYGPVCEEAV